MLLEGTLAAETSTLSSLLMSSLLMTASEVTVIIISYYSDFSRLGLFHEVNFVLVDLGNGRLLESQWSCD